MGWWLGLHQPPWSFGFDSQTRGTRENRVTPCVKVPGSSRVPAPPWVGSRSPGLCAGALRKIGDGSNSFPFICVCSDGAYLKNFTDPTSCEKCPYCEKGKWLRDCEKNTSGVCIPCQDCGDGEILEGCHRRNGGTCEKKNTKDAKWLVREPVCPSTATSGDYEKTTSFGLGGIGFETVFGASKLDAPFPCREACDGRTLYDSTQCGGPHACNVRTCVQFMKSDISVDDNDVMACPVAIAPGDGDALKRAKMGVSCAACDACGGKQEAIASDTTLWSEVWVWNWIHWHT
jgi:hypothetical protein